MALVGIQKFNRWMLLIVGGLFGVGTLGYIILQLAGGKNIKIDTMLLLVISFSGAYQGYKDLKNDTA